jgi:NAD(P)-dependent dehydrogenase (short-subunit alcohol dehydrogenase family)
MSKSFVITGSTRGIGFGVASELLRRGHRVFVSGRTSAAVDEAVAKLRGNAAHDAVAGAACDVARHDDLQRLWDSASAAFGRIDVWVNNAGISHARQPVGTLVPSELQAVMHTNLLGSLYATQIAFAGMRAQGGGTIYNMEGYGSSGMTAPGMSIYGASKFALTYFNKCMIAEARQTPVRICYLSPGIVVTDLLKHDLSGQSAADLERTRRIYNILADRLDTVAPFLAERIARDQPSGTRVAWLTGGKAALRFLTARFTKRNVFDDASTA